MTLTWVKSVVTQFLSHPIGCDPVWSHHVSCAWSHVGCDPVMSHHVGRRHHKSTEIPTLATYPRNTPNSGLMTAAETDARQVSMSNNDSGCRPCHQSLTRLGVHNSHGGSSRRHFQQCRHSTAVGHCRHRRRQQWCRLVTRHVCHVVTVEGRPTQLVVGKKLAHARIFAGAVGRHRQRQREGAVILLELLKALVAIGRRCRQRQLQGCRRAVVREAVVAAAAVALHWEG